jgi:hypothetical protein
MSLKSKRSPAEGDFLFEIDPETLEECVTVWRLATVRARGSQSGRVGQREAVSASEASSQAARPKYFISHELQL